MGTFEHVFRKAKSSELNYVIDHAHNDWLELGVEMGGIGFLLILMAAIWWFFHFIRVWWKRRSSFSLGISLGGMGAFLSLSLHSLTDFNMHIPANVLIFEVVLAIALLALHLRVNPENFYQELELPRYQGYFDNKNHLFYLILLVVLIWIPFRIIKPYLAERYIRTVPNSVSGQFQKSIETDHNILIKKAIRSVIT